MTTGAKTAHGTLIYRGGSSTPKTGGQVIEEVFNIELPEEVAEAIDASSHDVTTKEFIPGGLTDSGEVVVEMYYKAGTGQELMRGDRGGAATGYYINLAGGGTQKQLDFSALVTNFKLSAGRGEAITARATLKITAAITFTAQS